MHLSHLDGLHSFDLDQIPDLDDLCDLDNFALAAAEDDNDVTAARGTDPGFLPGDPF